MVMVKLKLDALILGGGGLLGDAFAQALGPAAKSVGRAALNPADPAALLHLVKSSSASTIINCAAHTDVDGAESDSAAAYRVNALLPQLLAAACHRYGKRLIHFSSTGCYGRWKDEAYTEFDPVEPTTVHHKSKVAGEVAVRSLTPTHLIIRTGWLFGGAPSNPKNFVWRRLLEAHRTRRLISDPYQSGCPTYVNDLVAQVRSMMGLELCGTFNVVSQGAASRLDYVKKIVESAGLACIVEASDAPFPRRAAVSNNETAVNQALGMLGMDQMPGWEDAVGRYAKELLISSEWKKFEA